MSNEDHFQKKTDQTSAHSAWAEFVDRQGQTPLTENSEGTEPGEPAAQVNLTPKQLDDLELDRQLRMLGKMSTPDDSFVSSVVSQTRSESNLNSQPRARLPVIGPSLATGTLEAPEATTETSEAIARTSEAVVSEANLESDFASSTDDGSDSSLASLPPEVTHRRPLALLALLASILFVGCFFGSMWWLGSAPEIADSPAPKSSVGELAKLKGISESQDDLLPDVPEIASEDDGDVNRSAANDALVEKVMDEDSSVGSVASTGEVDREDSDDILESADTPNSNPALVDANQKLDSAVGSTEDGMPEIGDEEKITDQYIAESSSRGPEWNSKLDWNLALQFHSNGVGSVTLNGEPVKAILLQDNAAFLLGKISGELQRRVRFLENRLGSKISGSITVEEAKYGFDALSELDEAVDKVDKHIAELDIRSLTVAELMRVRTGYREGIVANRDKLSSINLAHKNLSFYTEDEAFTICSVLSVSEGILRGLAKERLEWEKNHELQSTKSKVENRIEPKAFEFFANTGLLVPPDPKLTGQSIAGIQNLSPSALQRILQGAPSVELFRDANEFQQAKDFVYSNGSPEMKLRLSIDKIDRTLNDRSIVVTEDAQEVLHDRKSRAVDQLRRAIREGGGLGDGAPMEPLKSVWADRTDLHGLPLAMGKESQSDEKETKDLKQVSLSVGRTIGAFNGSFGSRDIAQNDAFRNLSIKEMVSFCVKDQAENPSSQKLKTIDQILQIDHPRLRLEMVGALRKSGSAAAIKLLVNKAKFDLEPEVRIAATNALADVEPDDIRGLLLEGLKYPWHVVAEHSAEALVRLEDQDAVPQLIEMLDLPHPHFPFEDNGRVVQRELVGINHMRNCLLCHAPSISSFDSVRGLVPHASRPLPPHFYDTTGKEGEVPYAVRADVTYLEQDFSVVQPVKNSGPWPSDQRIDYVVQKKSLTPAEAEKVVRQIGQSPNRNWNAIVFALRELTGETPADNSAGNWKRITAGRE